MKVAILARFKNDNFRQARIAAGFETMISLSFHTGISQQTLGQYENFKRYPTSDIHIFKLEIALKVPICDLFPKEYRDAVHRNLGKPIEKTFDILALPGHDQFILPDPADTYEIEEMRRMIEKGIEISLETLTKRQSRVLEMRFGLDGKHEHTLEEIANEEGVSKECIRQIEAKALRKLKHPSRSKAIRDFI